MTDLVINAPDTHHRSNRTLLAVAVLLVAIVVAVTMSLAARGGSKPVSPVNDVKIPQVSIPHHLITQAAQERADWGELETWLASQQSDPACRVGRPC